jgi:archaellum component FlaC
MSEMEMLETNTKRIKTRLEVFKKQWYASGFKSTETQDATFETLADNIQTLQE